jgi:lysophospholipase L1-like esterase
MSPQFLALLLISNPPGTIEANPDFYLRSGDRVVFYGDSITEGTGYAAFVETFVRTRLPNLDVRFVNAGWGGDTVFGGRGGDVKTRVNRDVASQRPTVITVMLGMNDAGVRSFDETLFNRFRTGYSSLIDSFQTLLPDSKRITIIKPSPYDDFTVAPNFPGGYNGVLQRYGGVATVLANNRGLTVADFNQPVVNLIERAAIKDRDKAGGLLPDRVHPHQGVHWVMAAALLQTWRAPTLITAVEIDAQQLKATLQTNTTVGDLVDQSGLRWTQYDRSLPWPIPRNNDLVNFALENSPLPDSMNAHMLRVTGLERGVYELSINGLVVGRWSDRQLENSVNLTRFETPMMLQAREVHQLTLQRLAIRNARWRSIEVSLQEAPSEARDQALAAMLRLEEDIVQRQLAAAVPKASNYELLPISTRRR